MCFVFSERKELWQHPQRTSRVWKDEIGRCIFHCSIWFHHKIKFQLKLGRLTPTCQCQNSKSLIKALLKITFCIHLLSSMHIRCINSTDSFQKKDISPKTVPQTVTDLLGLGNPPHMHSFYLCNASSFHFSCKIRSFFFKWLPKPQRIYCLYIRV